MKKAAYMVLNFNYFIGIDINAHTDNIEITFDLNFIKIQTEKMFLRLWEKEKQKNSNGTFGTTTRKLRNDFFQSGLRRSTWVKKFLISQDKKNILLFFVSSDETKQR